jgi:hypothetical protein
MSTNRESNAHDHLEIRCPKLGGEVAFVYCKKESGDLPCSRILTCWHIYFPVETYLRKHLTKDEWDRCFNQPTKDKVTTLVELIEAAKKRQARSD